jgi:hypothetical protein
MLVHSATADASTCALYCVFKASSNVICIATRVVIVSSHHGKQVLVLIVIADKIVDVEPRVQVQRVNLVDGY